MNNEAVLIHKVFANMITELHDLEPQIEDVMLKIRIRAIIHRHVIEMNQIIFPSIPSEINKS